MAAAARRFLLLAMGALFCFCTEEEEGTDGPKDSAADLAIDGHVAGEVAPADLLPAESPRQDQLLLDLSDATTGDSGPCKPGEFFVYSGQPKCKTLPAGVTLPIDSEQEANDIKSASGCTCTCEGGWKNQLTKWVCYCCSRYPDCLVEIEKTTAKTRCEEYG